MLSAIVVTMLNADAGIASALTMAFTLAFIFVGLGGFLYLLPSYIAACRDAPRFAGILGLNLMAGWTGLGWLATLIWAFVDAKKDPPQVIVQHVYNNPANTSCSSSTTKTGF